MPLDSAQLAALAAVVREGSFERAGRALHVTPSAVSQRIKLLEEEVGQVLVVRKTPCTPTRAGKAIYRHALQVELLESDLRSALQLHDTVTAEPMAMTLALAVNADSLATWLIGALSDFARHGGPRVEVMVDDQDYTAEWLRSGRVVVLSPAQPSPCRAAAASRSEPWSTAPLPRGRSSGAGFRTA
jgi:LysR family transcriptional regulator (chromosome initiation inhibitor)